MRFHLTEDDIKLRALKPVIPSFSSSPSFSAVVLAYRLSTECKDVGETQGLRVVFRVRIVFTCFNIGNLGLNLVLLLIHGTTVPVAP